MNLLSPFEQHWKKEFASLLVPGSRLLVTVSGGVDSVVLLDLLSKTGLDIAIAHCNFGLRGEESVRDENFVCSLAAKYHKEIYVAHFDTQGFAASRKISIQEAARTLRYDWFRELIDSWTAADTTAGVPHYILTAHHADDNIETVMMHFFRGTGLQGLTGIQPVQKEKRVLRPLLIFRRKEIEAYAAANQLSFVEDSSNASDKYTRNYFRNRLLPDIQQVFPQVEENLLQNINRLNEINLVYKAAIKKQLSKLIFAKGNEVHIPVLLWKKADPLHTITWEIIRPYGFTAAQTDEVIRLLDAANGAYIASATHRIIHNRQWMIITTIATGIAGHIVIEADENAVVFEEGQLSLENIHSVVNTITHNKEEAMINSEKLKFPLLLRKWKQGDYFYPLGMQKKKKIARFLIDNKVSRVDKEKVWVIESDRKIVWVVGYRLDDRYKLTPQTKKVLSITYRK